MLVGMTLRPHRPSDHSDGLAFFNPPLPQDWAPAPRPDAWPEEPDDPEFIERGSPDGPRRVKPTRFLRWALSSLTDKPERIIDPPPQGDPFATPEPGRISITFIGHCTFLLRAPLPGGRVLTVMTDPIFSERCSPFSFIGPRRLRAPGRTLAELPKIDVLLISHCHYDHLDLPSLRAIARRDDPIVITPLGNSDLLAKAGLRRVSELDWWDSMRFGDVAVTCTPARHFAQRTPFDGGRRLWGGLTLKLPAVGDVGPSAIFFAGDTAHGPHWQEIREKLGVPDLALLPIGAYSPRSFLHRVHADPVEAVAAFLTLEAKKAVAMHFGTFPLSREPLGEPERCLADTVAWAGLPPDAFTPLSFGETRLVSLA
ncbi:MBL fold metallo-hydrolase [Acetobacter sp. DsW_063]|uniref:MBL fold metallo-hydrolase n=1 Tax=Acetobacter sp. DsW_063 TaxID=1514894 RepID=UPI000A390EF2|nr:MBL fold metallo-hydrolase [Acetobacter sp. DsW_063]